VDHHEFIVEHYKLALDYLQRQFDRLWLRFNFFLTVQMALFGFLGWLAYDKGELTGVRFVAGLGLFVSALWYVVAAQDRYLVDVYRGRTRAAAERIAGIDEIAMKDYGATYVGAAAPSDRASLVSWYWQEISITRLPVYVAMTLGIVWLMLLITGGSWLQP
jgi:hypothetical protein